MDGESQGRAESREDAGPRIGTSSAPDFPSEGRARRCLWLLLGPMLALLLPEFVLRGSPVYWSFVGGWPPGSPAHAEALLRLAEPGSIDVAVVGSSRALEDVEERLMDRSLQPLEIRSLNLGILGSAALSTAMMVRPVIRLQPRLVLFVLSPDALRSNDPLARARNYDPAIAAQIFEARSYLEERSFHLWGLVQSASLLCRHRAELRKWFLNRGDPAFRIHPRDVGEPGRKMLEDWLQVARSRKESLVIDGTGPNVQAVRVLARELRLAGIRLVACPAPASPVVHDAAMEERLDVLLERLSRQEGFQLLERGVLGEYGPEDFMDPFHLGREGRRRFTRAVAEQLRPHLSGPRDAL